jgi:hypothetical protein
VGGPEKAALRCGLGRLGVSACLCHSRTRIHTTYTAPPAASLQDSTGILDKAELVDRVKQAAAAGPEGEAPAGYTFDPATGYFYSTGGLLLLTRLWALLLAACAARWRWLNLPDVLPAKWGTPAVLLKYVFFIQHAVGQTYFCHRFSRGGGA